MNDEKPTVQKRSLGQFVRYAASSSDSDESSLLPARGRTRRKSAVHDDDRNYVAESDDDDRDADEEAFEIPENERATVLFDFNRERDRRMAGVVNIPDGRYTEKERSLFLKLAMRGFEPLAPKHWQFDFPTLPDSLFPESGKEEDPIIKLTRSTAFYGKLLSLRSVLVAYFIVSNQITWKSLLSEWACEGLQHCGKEAGERDQANHQEIHPVGAVRCES